ncbi:putative mitochondrial protein [Cucumis melo var. makuwa]|uniref:Mitochondrial protein n=1 Tax=Cucumis melo var. makuwa TaxID=1194695 RepID=A0A5A7SKP6_CUCMM|nr:putative mitochondrial protein [Cucumis melo var. makuwa]TYK09647.1 putative mitochondrial protein [Cucumis melo var. makuwa]
MTEGEELETTCVIRHGELEFPVVLFGLRILLQFVKGFLKKASSLIELLKKDIQWGWNLECLAAFDGLKQAMTEKSILAVADVTKSFKVGIEQFNYLLLEYLRHFIDSRQENWVQLLNGKPQGSQICEGRGIDERHRSIVPRESLEEDGEEGESEANAPLRFERGIRFSSSSVTMTYDHLLIQNRKKIEKSRKSLLTQ